MQELDLLYGDNLTIQISADKELSIKHPKLIEIKKLGFDTYSSYISFLTMKPTDIADILWFDMKIWYEDLTQWQLFIDLYRQYPEEVKNSLLWFIGLEFVPYVDEEGRFYLYNKENEVAINEYYFMKISDYIKKINFMPKKSDFDGCAGKIAKLYKLERQQRRRKWESKIKSKINLSSMISSLIWKGNKGVEIWELPIYSIYEGYFRLSAIDNYDKTMTALYSGNIDTTKNKIDVENINWSNVISIDGDTATGAAYDGNITAI